MKYLALEAARILARTDTLSMLERVARVKEREAMAMKSDRDIIRSALIRAIKWEQGLLDAHAHITNTGSVRTEINKRIAAYTGLLEKKYGGVPVEPDWKPIKIEDVK